VCHLAEGGAGVKPRLNTTVFLSVQYKDTTANPVYLPDAENHPGGVGETERGAARSVWANHTVYEADIRIRPADHAKSTAGFKNRPLPNPRDNGVRT